MADSDEPCPRGIRYVQVEADPSRIRELLGKGNSMSLHLTCSRGRSTARAAALGAALAAAAPASSTILTFDQVRGASAGNPVIPTFGGATVPLDYGDRVVGSPMNVPGGQFTYGQAGEGFTPNVSVEIFSGAASPAGAGVTLWEAGYGDLSNVLLANNASNFLAVRLTADPGHRVGLFGFDLAGWPNSDYLIRGVSVIGDAGLLFSQLDVLVEGDLAGPRHTSFLFADGLFGSELLLTIDFSNLGGGQHDNIGLDNLRFGQDPPPAGPPDGGGPVTPALPEPGTLSLAAAALLGTRLLRRRAKRR